MAQMLLYYVSTKYQMEVLKMKKARFLVLTLLTLLCVTPSLVLAGSATISWQANTEPDLKEYRVYYGTVSRHYGSPIPVGKLTSYTVGNLSDGVTYYFAVTAVDTADNESGYSQEVTKTIADSQLPTVAVTSPTSQPTYDTSQATLNLGGTAADNVGVTSVTWSNSRGGTGTASGTTSWSVSGIPLSSGANVIVVTARDQAGNQKSVGLTVTYTPPDTTAPASPVGVTVQ